MFKDGVKDLRESEETGASQDEAIAPEDTSDDSPLRRMAAGDVRPANGAPSPRRVRRDD